MKQLQALILLHAFYFISASFLFAQTTEEIKPSNLKYEEVIPTDPDVALGQFENGLKYYIKVNKKPENRATLWLAVNAGAVLEDDNQQGLAHFTEHMSFNGTKNFKKHELIDFLESIGMKFGADINAYTSFDETVYFIHVPTDSAYYVETGFQILEDWAHNVSFEEEEIDKERGVVGEEWRLGQGAWKRMIDKQLPILFKDSRYAERLPIGKKEIIDTSKYETLRKFYRDWYRPDLMAVVAVGDFDKDWIYNLIQKYFASIPKAENPRERTMYPVPNHQEVLFAVATDKEADRTQIGVYFKSDLQTKKTVADYRIMIMANLYSNMLNNRLNELTKNTDPPFLYGYTGKGSFVRTKEVYYLGGGVKEDGIERGLDALLTEANRVKKHGFTESEFERAKIEIMRGKEQAYKERDKTESVRFARNYVYNFLSENPMPGVEQSLALYKQLFPDIKLEEINELANKWITNNNRVIMISAPEKENVVVPNEEQLTAVLNKTDKKDIKPYEDNVSNEPLVADVPAQVDIVVEKTNDELGITELKLANGVNVILKPTDFKNDEIIFNAYSFGGNSLMPDDQFMSANSAARIIQESGVGAFNSIELNKKLAGKVVSVRPYITDLAEGIRGSASPQDIETMFQLIYLYFTAPRQDEDYFKSYLSRMKGFIENRSASPEAEYADTIQVTLAQHHMRSRPWTEALLDEIDYHTALNFYKNRFADASDFNFFFVGNFEIEKIKPLIQTYLGGLPVSNRVETWKDTKVFPPKGVIKKEVHKGIERKSMVQLSFVGAYEGEYKNLYKLSSLVDVLRIKLREVMREDMGGTYGVWMWHDAKYYPRKEYSLNISFGCNPERVDEMIQSLFEQIDSIKTFGPAQINIDKVKEIQIRDYEVNLKKNGYWINKLYRNLFYGVELTEILKYPDHVKTLSTDMIKEAANNYLNTENYVQVVLYPKEGIETSEEVNK